MEDFALWLSGVIWGAGATIFIMFRFFKTEWKHKYSWKCPKEGCFFTISANNDPGIVTMMAESHEEEHRREE